MSGLRTEGASGAEPTFIPNYNVVQPPGTTRIISYQMAGKRTVDIKLSFEQYDMMPGPGGKKFMRNLFLYGGTADTQGNARLLLYRLLPADRRVCRRERRCDHAAGYSRCCGCTWSGRSCSSCRKRWADSLHRSRAAACSAQQHAARKARLKQSFSFLCSHISDSSTLE